MKYTDLVALEDMDRDAMSKVVGGLKWGQFLSDRLHFFDEGRANLPAIKTSEETLGIPNLGQLIQYSSDLSGYPGNNTAKIGRTDLPPGLPPG